MSRQSILDVAKYLRNVRPIDPEEVVEYVEGGAHPAVVRQTLRENALSLGLVEREDGTFVPASEGPLSPDFDGVREVPERYLSRLEDLLVERFGPDWSDGESGAALREEIRRLKEQYYRQHPVEYSSEAALGYAIYHLPDYYAATGYALDELGSRNLLPSRLRVLDVGAGVGGPALGLADYAEDALVEYHAVEPSAAADVLEELLAETPRNFHPTVHRSTAEAFEPELEYDLVLFANVLIELSDPVAVLKRYLAHLSPDGSLLALSPADKNTATGLREVEHEVVSGGEYTVFAPTLRLWPGREPTDHCWSFDCKPDLDVPPLQRRLDEGRRAEDERGERDAATGEFVNRDIQYAYSVLRRDRRTRLDASASPERFAPFAESEAHVTDRIDCIAVKLSHSLSEGNPLFLLGDGSQSESHYAVLTRETGLNRPLVEADYGDVLVFESVLVLWNDDEDSYNLVVDEECVIDRVG
ncbi:methyltransferase domain protein [Halalkalicoccus paucihalophilus]|uniref:Methyltransferase domain protein n=1 Tax=Halalkalicoccus paucihalophilus TaxID=1008153 RepID=A0A151AI04_9EURY|nr:methyltransferase domain-containing protein [Halalkalicoccus paucihalophilus]KYH27212.1 methyltransferase domain protein [Halalkalicoccus paucihalophilus]